jgi:PAS domain S-box-containing protein
VTGQRSLISVVTRSLVTYSVLVSLLFLAGIVLLYQARLKEQRTDAAERVNLLLQVSLENAMLKRDIPGLKDIVERLGHHEGIKAVMILDPQGTIRFASDPQLLNRRFGLTEGDLCSDCRLDPKIPLERSELRGTGIITPAPVLRSVKSVQNREECIACHGKPAANPVNGILVVEHDAEDLKRNALLGALTLAGSGMLVVLGLVAGLWQVLRRNVLTPVAGLTAASRDIAAGHLDHRVIPGGGAEIADLGHAFNAMAEKLKSSYAELSAREHFVQALLDALPDGVRVIDQNFNIVLVNRAYCEQHGRANGTEVGRFCYQSSHGRNEPCIPTLVTCPVAALTNGTEQIKYHARHVRADGQELSVEVNAVRIDIDGPAGPRRLIIEAIRDLDAALKISQEQRLSEIGQLATGVAHEIRNPLSSVAMLVPDVERGFDRRPADETRQSLHLIGQEVDRCLAITESLLKLGAPTGQAPQLIEVASLIRDIVALLRFDAEERDIAVHLAIEPSLRVLAADSDLRIVLINLIQNAFHAMPNGGDLYIAALRKGRDIELSVRDTGVGIAAADITAIFMPFWSKRADGVNGTGLGLSICQSVVRGLGGTMRVVSQPGHGATFTVSLPDPDTEADHARTH